MRHIQANNSGVGNIEELSRRRQKRLQKDAELLERLLLRSPHFSAADAAAIAMSISPAPLNDWTFVMISPAQNAEVVRWITENSKRPMKALALWAHLFEVMRSDTGEILRTRKELAERVNVSPADLSKIITELTTINAVRREKTGRSVRYFMNANVATHIPTPEARRNAQERAGPLLLLMEGGAA